MCIELFSTGLGLSDDSPTGMLDTESAAMESNGDAFLPDHAALSQTPDWSAGQVAPESITSILPEHQDALGQQQQMNSELGSVEKAVEHFQLASAQLFEEAQPPLPPQPEDAEKPSEPATESEEAEQGSQDMNLDPETAVEESSTGK